MAQLLQLVLSLVLYIVQIVCLSRDGGRSSSVGSVLSSQSCMRQRQEFEPRGDLFPLELT